MCTIHLNLLRPVMAPYPFPLDSQPQDCIIFCLGHLSSLLTSHWLLLFAFLYMAAREAPLKWRHDRLPSINSLFTCTASPLLTNWSLLITQEFHSPQSQQHWSDWHLLLSSSCSSLPSANLSPVPCPSSPCWTKHVYILPCILSLCSAPHYTPN